MTDDAQRPDDDGGDDGFLARWSRRKQAARTAPPQAPVEAPGESPEPEVAFDPATLPPLDTLGADSDYTVFLRTGVPKALRLAALRKAWASDPAITGHRPLVDYDWDCNAPGYGALRPTDDAGKVTEALFRHLRKAPPDGGVGVARDPAPDGGDSGAAGEEPGPAAGGPGTITSA